MGTIRIKFTAEMEINYNIPFTPVPLEEQRGTLQQVLYEKLLESEPRSCVRVTDYHMIAFEEDIKNGN